MLCSSQGQIASISSSTSGFVLTSNGTATPSFQSVSGAGAVTTIDGDSGSMVPSSGVVTISGGTTGLTTSASVSTMDLTGTLIGANGGTGVNNSGRTITLSGGATGYVLTSDSSGNGTWQAPNTQTTYTPALAFAGSSAGITYTTQLGYYSQIGKMVTFAVYIVLSSKGGANMGNATISLPVTSGPTLTSPVPIPYTTVVVNSGNISPLLLITPSSNVGTLYDTFFTLGPTEITLWSPANFQNNSLICFSGTYFTS
jgi:hypothetical protein